MSQPGRHRAWVFTDFSVDAPSFGCQFLAYQLELCPSSGRLHWQGYAYFAHPRDLKSCKRLLPGAHWEVRRGSHEDALKYVTKTDTRAPGASPVIAGQPPAQGRRRDLEDFCESILAGSTNRELAERHPTALLRYSKGVEVLRVACLPNRTWKTQVVVLWGPAGCGKSRWAHEWFPDAYYKDPTRWWNGYSGEKVIILDEFYGQLPLEYMLKLMDRYPLNIETKGGYVKFNGELLILTSNTDPRHWYRGLTADGIVWQPQFFRRIEHEFRFDDGHWQYAVSPIPHDPVYRRLRGGLASLSLESASEEEEENSGSVPGDSLDPIEISD